MNEIITKCITELEKPSPNTDYVRGLLEAALAMNGGQTLFISKQPTALNNTSVGSVPAVVVSDVPPVPIGLLKELKENAELDTQ